MRRDERPVQEEAADDEEDRDPDLQPRGHLRGKARVAVGAGEERGVRAEDRQGSDRPQRVDEREPRVRVRGSPLARDGR
jgi:hypothetical protein